MDTDARFYLSSLDSYRFEQVRTCRFIREVRFATGKIAVLADLDPGVQAQDFGEPEDIRTCLLTPRFEGASLSPIDEFPSFVFIALPSRQWDSTAETVNTVDVQIIGWGELYRTREDAQKHRFD